ncbi:DUF2973 domain-containing protein [Gloeocapsopsis dulcis]|uniref:DUF2973 domain-containing protein n=1 Tax=Gloeocapsopsis dulcis AAB1 = 1H9 TaxID=1433147 RepID=A0A6N8FUE2_9CHRO|nr:DUF2973 domain-containing protein [Gloeocapsopsis dulcis]MUL36723.1 hypothetical protein [Gloeocapsopsis dulcis AAB1 = 1H9]WNN91297.1 DUF2973 domain-containing protein [Gloeocapsopsis dulcis]
MLHLLYILAFTILALIAVSNLIRNLFMFSRERDRTYPARSPQSNQGSYPASAHSVPHPELLDTSGNIIKDPLLVIRSISVEDARQQLDALYESSPGYKGENQEEA